MYLLCYYFAPYENNYHCSSGCLWNCVPQYVEWPGAGALWKCVHPAMGCPLSEGAGAPWKCARHFIVIGQLFLVEFDPSHFSFKFESKRKFLGGLF